MYTLIIVDYNSLDRTIEYVKLCQQYLGESGASHVVIVENGTPENPVKMLGADYGEPKIRQFEQIAPTVYCFEKNGQEIAYCNSGANLGYAKGNNLGVRIADTIWNDRFYIISNNDLVFDKAMDISVATRIFEENPEIGIIGPRVVTPEGKLQSPRQWKSAFSRLILNYWISAFSGLFGSEFQSRMYDRVASDTVVNATSGKCDWVCGCFMFIKADAFHKAGLFDEYTFLYGEEMIVSKRMEAIGSSVYYCRELEIIHKHGQTTTSALNTLKMNEIDFDANHYFYKTYMHTSLVVLMLSQISFKLFCSLYKLKLRLKRMNAKEC